MRNLSILLCSTLLTSIAYADPIALYDGPQPSGLIEPTRDAYQACISKFTGAVQPASLRLTASYFGGKSVEANHRIYFINGSYVRDGERVAVGIACVTNYRGERVTSLKATVGGHYAMRAGSNTPELLAEN